MGELGAVTLSELKERAIVLRDVLSMVTEGKITEASFYLTKFTWVPPDLLLAFTFGSVTTKLFQVPVWRESLVKSFTAWVNKELEDLVVKIHVQESSRV